MLTNAILKEQAEIIAQAKQTYNEMKNASNREHVTQILDKRQNIKTLLLGGSFKPKNKPRFELPLTMIINSFFLMIVLEEDINVLEIIKNVSLCEWLAYKNNNLKVQPPNLMQIKFILKWIARVDPQNELFIKALGQNSLFGEALKPEYLCFNDAFLLFNMLVSTSTIDLAYTLWQARLDVQSWYKEEAHKSVYLGQSDIRDLFIRILDTRHGDLIRSFWQHNITLQLDLLENHSKLIKSILKGRSQLPHPFFLIFINHIKDSKLIEQILNAITELELDSNSKVLNKYQFATIMRLKQLNDSRACLDSTPHQNSTPPGIEIEVLQKLAAYVLGKKLNKTRRLITQYPALMDYLTGNKIVALYPANAKPILMQIKPDASVRYLNILIELEATDLIQMFWTLASTQVKDHLIGGAYDNAPMTVDNVYKLYNALVKMHSTEMANYVYDNHPELSRHIVEMQVKSRFPEVVQLLEQYTAENCETDHTLQEDNIAASVNERSAFSQESENEAVSTSFSTLYGYHYGHTIPSFPIQVAKSSNVNNLDERPEKRMKLNH